MGYGLRDLFLCEASDDGLISSYGFADGYEHLRIERQVHVHAATEFDKTEVGVAVRLMTWLGVRDDASRHGSGYLPNGDLYERSFSVLDLGNHAPL